MGLSITVCETLVENNYRVRVALGQGISGRDSVLSAISQLHGVNIVEQVNYARDLSEAKLVITAAGTSLWEALCLGKHTIALIVADNQKGQASRAAELTHRIRVIDAQEDPTRVEEIPQLLAELYRVDDRNASLSLELAHGTTRLVDGILKLMSSESEKTG